MNASLVLSRRVPSSLCLSCRRSVMRHFSSAPRLAAPIPEFQPYRLRGGSGGSNGAFQQQPPPPPRSAGGPDTSISHHVEPALPRVFETRPPRSYRGAGGDGGGSSGSVMESVTVPEGEAQESRPAFAAAARSDLESESHSRTSADVPEPAHSSSTSSSSSSLSSSSTASAAATSSTSTSTTTTSTSTSARPRRPHSKLRAPRKAAMKLTPSAVAHLRSLLEGPEPRLIKVGVRNRGCSGLAYHLEYVERAGAFDEAVDQDGVRVLIDSKALFSIIGSEMDWVEDKLNQRFVFRNPNIKEQCGCGESFMV